MFPLLMQEVLLWNLISLETLGPSLLPAGRGFRMLISGYVLTKSRRPNIINKHVFGIFILQSISKFCENMALTERKLTFENLPVYEIIPKSKEAFNLQSMDFLYCNSYG